MSQIDIRPYNIYNEKTIHYIKSHWNGEQSLARSFWINFFLINLAQNIIMKAYPNLFELFSLWPSLIMAIIFYSIYVWGIVGIFRSSAKYSWANIWRLLVTLILAFSLFIQIGELYLLIKLFSYAANTTTSF